MADRASRFALTNRDVSGPQDVAYPQSSSNERSVLGRLPFIYRSTVYAELRAHETDVNRCVGI